jgi:hypothetical protein
MANWTGSLRVQHTIPSKGHFYYIFYSDNDLETNTINARFEVNATTYNFTLAAHKCLNTTKCSFDLRFFGGDGTVYVEADSDVLLISTCEKVSYVFIVSCLCLNICPYFWTPVIKIFCVVCNIIFIS